MHRFAKRASAKSAGLTLALSRHVIARTRRAQRSGRAALPAILIRAGLGSSLSRQCQERRRVGAIFLPSRIGRVVCKFVLAPAFASTDRAYALKVSHHLRVGVRDFHPIEVDLVHAPIQQIRGVRPFPGEDGEIGSAHAHVAGDAFHLGRTTIIKVRHRPAGAVPPSPPMRKPTNKAGPSGTSQPPTR